MLWRDFLTRRIVNLYLDDEAYYRLDVSGRTCSLPDQRIADDVRAFTVTTLSFVIMLFSSTLTVVTFSGVLVDDQPAAFWRGCPLCGVRLVHDDRPGAAPNFSELRSAR
ncbi:hypothetical protein [Ensifer canadensis]